jgi:hypothetical protein
MTTTTLPSNLPSGRLSSVRVAIVLAVAAVLLVATFAVGRASAPSHTVQSIVGVPSAAAATGVCRVGPC